MNCRFLAPSNAILKGKRLNFKRQPLRWRCTFSLPLERPRHLSNRHSNFTDQPSNSKFKTTVATQKTNLTGKLYEHDLRNKLDPPNVNQHRPWVTNETSQYTWVLSCWTYWATASITKKNITKHSWKRGENTKNAPTSENPTPYSYAPYSLLNFL